MMTRREYAVSLGLAKPGRGRMSGEAHAAINKAVAEGKTFKDMPQSVGKQIDSKDVGRVSETDIFSATPDPIHNGGWSAIVDGKRIKISGKSVCAGCGYSLDYQDCLVSEVVGPNSEIVRVMR